MIEYQIYAPWMKSAVSSSEASPLVAPPEIVSDDDNDDETDGSVISATLNHPRVAALEQALTPQHEDGDAAPLDWMATSGFLLDQVDCEFSDEVMDSLCDDAPEKAADESDFARLLEQIAAGI